MKYALIMLCLLMSGAACSHYHKAALISKIDVNEVIVGETDIVAIPFTLKNCSNSKIYVLDVALKLSYVPDMIKSTQVVQYGFPTTYLIDNRLFHEYVPMNRHPKLLVVNPNETIGNTVSIKTGIASLDKGHHNICIKFLYNDKPISTSSPIGISEIKTWGKTSITQTIDLLIN